MYARVYLLSCGQVDEPEIVWTSHVASTYTIGKGLLGRQIPSAGAVPVGSTMSAGATAGAKPPVSACTACILALLFLRSYWHMSPLCWCSAGGLPHVAGAAEWHAPT